MSLVVVELSSETEQSSSLPSMEVYSVLGKVARPFPVTPSFALSPVLVHSSTSPVNAMETETIGLPGFLPSVLLLPLVALNVKRQMVSKPTSLSVRALIILDAIRSPVQDLLEVIHPATVPQVKFLKLSTVSPNSPSMEALSALILLETSSSTQLHVITPLDPQDATPTVSSTTVSGVCVTVQPIFPPVP